MMQNHVLPDPIPATGSLSAKVAPAFGSQLALVLFLAFIQMPGKDVVPLKMTSCSLIRFVATLCPSREKESIEIE